MADDQLDKLDQKKKELEQELQQIEGKLDNSIDQVKENVNSSLDPKTIIKKHPLPTVGAAALIGFLVGHEGSSSKNKSSAGEFSGALLAELKKIATQKAILFATDYVEELLEEKADTHLSVSDDTD